MTPDQARNAAVSWIGIVLQLPGAASPDVADFVERLRQPLIQKPFDLRTLSDVLDQIVPAGAAPAPPPV